MYTLSRILNTVQVPLHGLGRINFTGCDPVLPSPFLIGEAGAAAINACGYAASELWCLKTGRMQQISIDLRCAAMAQRSHDYLQVLDGKKEDLWSPLSGFYQTKDNRWIQFHCNFPHHRLGIINFLRCADHRASVSDAVKKWDAFHLENELSQRGMCVAVVRTPEEWEAHSQSQAISQLPLMEILPIGVSSPEPMKGGCRPLSGIRVLDLTRVIAGPICGRTLAEQGADVMLISSPKLPFISSLVIDTGHGKYSAYLDLEKIEDRQQLIKLIQQSDIFSQAYRPGGLAAKGFSPEDLMRIRPGIIYISLSAYSHIGPWAMRRGFDSLVQSATGIVYEQTAGKDKPQHLPAQSLDYITGYLAAFGAMEALRRRALYGGSYLVRVSLAQTAHWFKSLGRTIPCNNIPTQEMIRDLLIRSNTPFGQLEYLKPVLKMSETQPYWDKTTVPLGTHPPEWKILSRL